jgi:hypothetical protein
MSEQDTRQCWEDRWLLVREVLELRGIVSQLKLELYLARQVQEKEKEKEKETK